MDLFLHALVTDEMNTLNLKIEKTCILKPNLLLFTLQKRQKLKKIHI